jgi:hypothetical protein
MCLFTRCMWSDRRPRPSRGQECPRHTKLIRNHSLYFGRVSVADQRCGPELAFALLRLRGQNVAEKSLRPLHFPRPSFLEALRSALVCL